MNNEDEIDQEPTVEPRQPSLPKEKPPSALSKIRRDISDEELLSSPGALKLLIDRLDRAENQNTQLRTFQERFYSSDKKVGVLEEKLKQQNTFEILYSSSLALGAVLVGLAPSAWDAQPYGVLSLIAGFALMIGSAVAKGKKNES